MSIVTEGLALEDLGRPWPRRLRAMRWAGPFTEGGGGHGHG